ncbi:MAG: hypothetical protein ACT4NY_30010 [Pseudonocardiales bacterium]
MLTTSPAALFQQYVDDTFPISGTWTITAHPDNKETVMPTNPTIPSIPVVAPNRWVLIRDKIQIDSSLKNRITEDVKGLPPNCPIYLVAREITHAPDWSLVLPGHPIVIVCDSYNPNGGGIDTRGSGGARGVDGQNGAKGIDVKSGQKTGPSEDSARGKPGTSGTDGSKGNSAHPITLIARKILSPWLLYTKGGNGRSGGNAGNGGDGGDILYYSADEQDWTIKPNERPKGGAGGNGGNAGKAGNGANITIKYVTSQLGFCFAEGGVAGIGGKKGIGGLSGGEPPLTPAPSGKAGISTPAGVNGTVTQTQLSSDAWWAAAVGTLPVPVLQGWADHWERVGEYRFRKYIQANPATKPLRDSAVEDFASVLLLRPNSPRAQRFKDYLKEGLTPLGLPYDYDLKPKIDLFEEFLTDYGVHRNWLFDQFKSFLLRAGDNNQKKAIITSQINFYADYETAMIKDRAAAVSDAAEAQTRFDYAVKKSQALTERLNQLSEARKNEPMSIGDYFTIIGAVVGAVVSVATAAISLGTSLIGAGGALAALASLGGLASSTAALTKANDLVNNSDPTTPSLTDQGKALIGSIQDVVKNTKQFLNKAQAVHDLINAIIEGEPDAPEPQILAQQVEAAFEVTMARFGVTRSALAMQGAELKVQAYQNGKAGLAGIHGDLSANERELSKVARMLLRQFQIYNDLFFIRYQFYVNRAFDLYTLPAQPKTRATRFDFGYVHPDEEEDTFAALERSDGSAAQRITMLLGACLTSQLYNLPGKTKDEYNAYILDSDMDSAEKIWSITSPSVLNALRTTGAVTFQTSFSDLDDDFGQPAELKIQQIGVALVGARNKMHPNQKLVKVVVTHTGQELNRRRGNNAAISILAPPRHDTVSAKLDGIDLVDLASAITPQEEPDSWGRSPITTWRIAIASQTASELDLSELSEVQFGVKYGFWSPFGAAKKQAALQRGAVDAVEPGTPELV